MGSSKEERDNPVGQMSNGMNKNENNNRIPIRIIQYFSGSQVFFI